MLLRILTVLVLVFGWTCAAPATEDATANKAAIAPKQSSDQDSNDLKTAASSYRSDWGRTYPSGFNGYSATGYGTLDDKYSGYNSNGYSGYGNSYDGYGGNGYKGYSGYGATGYDGYGGNRGYGSGYGSYGSNVNNGYAGNGGYSGSGGYGGNGGYGGSGGNGGMSSYYGYNNPNYQGAYHLGYGYYNRRPGYGNIYSNGITPSLVTGYRGYSRR